MVAATLLNLRVAMVVLPRRMVRGAVAAVTPAVAAEGTDIARISNLRFDRVSNPRFEIAEKLACTKQGQSAGPQLNLPLPLPSLQSLGKPLPWILTFPPLQCASPVKDVGGPLLGAPILVLSCSN